MQTTEQSKPAEAQSFLTDKLATRRAAATHKHIVFGTLLKLSHPDDDFPDNAWWFNDASGMWQVSVYSNDEVKYGKQFEAVPNV